MDVDRFLADLADVLEVEPEALTDDYALDDTNWDSLALVSTIAIIEERFEVTVSGDALRGCASVGEVVALIRDRVGRG